MDVHPTIVLNDAVHNATEDLRKAGTAMADSLVERLTDSPHFAEFEIVVTGRIIDPASGCEIGVIEHRLPYSIFDDRDPDKQSRTE